MWMFFVPIFCIWSQCGSEMSRRSASITRNGGRNRNCHAENPLLCTLCRSVLCPFILWRLGPEVGRKVPGRTAEAVVRVADHQSRRRTMCFLPYRLALPSGSAASPQGPGRNNQNAVRNRSSRRTANAAPVGRVHVQVFQERAASFRGTLR